MERRSFIFIIFILLFAPIYAASLEDVYVKISEWKSGQVSLSDVFDVIANWTSDPCELSVEVCDGVDNNCDGEVDEGCDVGYFSVGEVVESEDGDVVSPMRVVSDSYVATDQDNAGSVSFTFNVTVAGDYMLKVVVSTPTGSDGMDNHDSFFVGVDNESARGDNGYVYDLANSESWVWDNVSLRGVSDNLADPKVWTLSSGLHEFVFYGREDGARVDKISLIKSEDGIVNCLYDTANPNANLKANALLAYFYFLSERSDKRVISGTSIVRRNFDDVFDEIYENINKNPGIIEGGYYHGTYTTGPAAIDPDISVNKYLIEWWGEGGLISVSMHPFNPDSGNGCLDYDADITAILTPGTNANMVWMRQLSLIADGLQELEDAGVVVLFRPFHERFWWGNYAGSNNNPYPALWKQMFDYMTYERGLDNILWMYSPGGGDAIGYAVNKYPGDSYVDIVAFDYYDNSINEPPQLIIDNYNFLRGLGKPFGFGEYGPKVITNDYSYTVFLEALKEDFPDAVFSQVWDDRYSLSWGNGSGELLNDSIIVNRDEISWEDFLNNDFCN